MACLRIVRESFSSCAVHSNAVFERLVVESGAHCQPLNQSLLLSDVRQQLEFERAAHCQGWYPIMDTNEAFINKNKSKLEFSGKA